VRRLLLFVCAATGLFAACGGSPAPSAPTVTLAQTSTPSCQANSTAQIAFSNRSTTATYTIVWDGASRVTLAPGATSPTYTEAANVAHTLQFLFSGTTSLACSNSSPTLAQCSTNNTLSCSGELKADIRSVGSGLSTCFTGLCTKFSYDITNNGLGCATHARVITRFYGSDGNGPQLGIDVPMDLVGQSLSAYFFRPGTTVTVFNTVSFNDVRSVHTVFKPAITWDDVACQ
jgi:hypothetical protein